MTLNEIACFWMDTKEVGVSVDDLTSGKGEPRDTVIYLIKKYTGLTNRQIGEIFGGLSYSAVAKVNQRFAEKLKKDKQLRRKVKNIIDNMSYVKG